MGAVVRIEGASKRLVSANFEFRLDVGTLELERHQFIGFVGRSGSGKSTFLDILSLASTPDELSSYALTCDGVVTELAQPILSRRDRVLSAIRLRQFGYVLQSGGLIDCLSVAENINLIPVSLGMEPFTCNHPLVRALDMEMHFDKRIAQLSGGQRQRVSILRSLSNRPQIVVADEPTAAIDETMADVIVQQLKRLARETGVIVALVSHDLDLVTRYCDQLVELRPRQVSEQLVVTQIGRP